MERTICIKGDTVYAVVKNSITFRLEVVTATVVKVSNGEIVLHSSRTTFETGVYYFPENDWGKVIFDTPEEAAKALELATNGTRTDE